MNILGTIIRNDEIIGVSQLHERINGDHLNLCFYVITKSTSVEISSPLIEDYKVATKREQEYLQAFRQQYALIKTTIAIMIGEASAIIQEEERKGVIEKEWKVFNSAKDKIASLLKSSKAKLVKELADHLGDAWACASKIKEHSL